MNQETLLYVILALNILYIPAFIYLFAKLKEIKYLVDQPVIQRLSSNSKFTPYKFDRSTSTEGKDSNRPKVHSHNPTSGGPKKDSKAGPRGGRERVRTPRNNRTRGGARQNQGRGTVVANQPAEDNNSSSSESRPVSPERKENITVVEVTRPQPQSKAPAENNSEPNGHINQGQRNFPSHGRRQLPSQKVEIPESVANSAPEAPVANNSDTGEITHGRRVKMKKAPSFDE